MPTVSRPSPLRERRRRETRDEIRRVALALVQGRGYDAVTVDLISQHAGVSARTFFNYFPDKESAMIAVPPPLPAVAVQEFLSHEGEALFVALIAARLELHPDDDQPQVVAAALTGALRAACQRWSRHPERRVLTEEVRACVTLLSTSQHEIEAS